MLFRSEEATGQRALTEQFVPAWRRGDEEARLDVAYAARDGATSYADVVVSHPCAAHVVRQAAVIPGHAASTAEKGKHRRYPGGRLVPVSVEVGGRSGDAHLLLQRSMCRALPAAERTMRLSRWRQRVAVCLQRGNAQLLRSAVGTQ